MLIIAIQTIVFLKMSAIRVKVYIMWLSKKKTHYETLHTKKIRFQQEQEDSSS